MTKIKYSFVVAPFMGRFLYSLKLITAIILLSFTVSCSKKLSHENPVDPVYQIENSMGTISGTAQLGGSSVSRLSAALNPTYRTTDHSGITIALSNSSLTATTDANGAYTIPNVPAGTYVVTISKTGYDSQTQTGIIVKTGETTTVALITISPTSTTGTIAGTAQLQGASDHTGISIALTPLSSLTGVTTSTGAFSISGVPAGTYTVTASKTGYTSQSQTGVAVTAGATTTVTTMTLPAAAPATATISGYVVSNSVLLAGVTVSLIKDGAGIEATTQTNISGAYSLTGTVGTDYRVKTDPTFYQSKESSKFNLTASGQSDVYLEPTTNKVWSDDFTNYGYTGAIPSGNNWSSSSSNSGYSWIMNSGKTGKGLEQYANTASDDAYSEVNIVAAGITKDIKLVFNVKKNNSVNTTDQYVRFLDGSSNNILTLDWSQSGFFQWSTSSGGYTNTSKSVNNNTWYKIEITITSDKKINIWITDSQASQVVINQTVGLDPMPNITTIRFYIKGFAASLGYSYIDDIEVYAP